MGVEDVHLEVRDRTTDHADAGSNVIIRDFVIRHVDRRLRDPVHVDQARRPPAASSQPPADSEVVDGLASEDHDPQVTE